jgi:hypothetical protein
VQGFFESGRAADLILLILALELLWLSLTKRLPLAEAAGLVLPGLLIVLGLRAALTGASWPWIAAPLALAFPVHLLDLRQRLRNSRRRD